jgi:pimeloyl-ACP methyl ester carboxylesterase
MLGSWLGPQPVGRLVSALLLALALNAGAQSIRDFHVPEPLPEHSVLVVGFVGGFEKWNDSHRGVRKVALSLRALNLPGVYVETLENRRRKLALKLIAQTASRQALAQSGRIVLYGQSWGGAAVVRTARDLSALGLRVLLTVQVDSVGVDDSVIPANVLNAVNIFQNDPFGIVGRNLIRAEDPGATRIIENTRMSYALSPYNISSPDMSWARRTLGGSHAKMEADEHVWAHVQDLIVRAIKDEL